MKSLECDFNVARGPFWRIKTIVKKWLMCKKVDNTSLIFFSVILLLIISLIFFRSLYDVVLLSTFTRFVVNVVLR